MHGRETHGKAELPATSCLLFVNRDLFQKETISKQGLDSDTDKEVKQLDTTAISESQCSPRK